MTQHSNPTTSLAGGSWDPSRPLVPTLVNASEVDDGSAGNGTESPWLVVVVINTDSPAEGATLAEAFERVLPDIHSEGLVVTSNRVVVALYREAEDVLEAALDVLHELDHWGFDADALLAGREEAPAPVLCLERVA